MKAMAAIAAVAIRSVFKRVIFVSLRCFPFS